MKRAGAFLLALLLCAAVFMPAALASRQLPLDIRAQFGSIEITDSTYWDSPETWFVLIRTPDKVNRLLCYVLKNGTWTQKFQTAAAVPQGQGKVRIVFTDQVRDFVHDRIIPGPVLVIMQYGTGLYESSVMARCGFVSSGPDTWMLFDAFFQDEQADVEIGEDTVTFRTPIDQDHERIKTVPVSIERDLRVLDFTEIPRTPEQAQEIPDDQ